MKTSIWKTLASGLLLTCLAGCLQTKDELTLNSDGSGKVRIETRAPASAASAASALAEEAVMEEIEGQAPALYPPNSLQEAKRFFPGKDFVLSVKQTNADKGDIVTVIEADFKDINSLLASPYGHAHQLTVELDKDGLAVKAVTGMQTAAQVAEMKPNGNPEMMEMMEAMPGMAAGELQKRIGEMRVEFRVTLPNPVATSNGARDGKSAAWTMERAKAKDAADFAQQLGVVMEARCAADGVKCTPLTPVRLGLLPFAQLTPGAVASKATGPDTNKIAAAVKFVPYGLTVTRGVDLSGQGGGSQSSAQLFGAVVVPQELAPQRWGEPALLEAVDSKGNDLKPKANQNGQFFGGRMMGGFDGDDDVDDDDAAAAAAKTTTDLRHMVSFSFRSPDWKVKEIARVKASVALHYFSGAEVVKLTNAIPANWIMSEAEEMIGRSGPNPEKHLDSPRLHELGLDISIEEATTQSGMTMLEMEVKGANAALLDAQAFDADGKPVPTIMANSSGGMAGQTTCQMIIAGAPKTPLSLAFSASGTSSTVEVPVLVEHVSLTEK